MNHLKMKMADNKIVYGTMLSEVNTPNIMRVLKVCGFDHCIIDCEHGYFDYTGVANLIAVANLIQLTVIVRIPKVDRECILKYMEMGADGLLIPMTSSAQDVEKVIEFSKYMPLGKRGLATQRAHTGYNPGNLTEYIKKANEDTVIIAQIESAQGIENIAEILQVEGVDGVVVGPNDMSLEMGVLGHYQHPMMQAAIQSVVNAAKNTGRWSGIISSNKLLLRQCAEMGMQFMSWNSEIGMIAESGREALQTLRT